LPRDTAIKLPAQEPPKYDIHNILYHSVLRRMAIFDHPIRFRGGIRNRGLRNGGSVQEWDKTPLSADGLKGGRPPYRQATNTLPTR